MNSDKETLESLGLDANRMEKIAERAEAGDFSDYDFSKTRPGRPIVEERTEMVSAAVGESRIAAMKRVTEEEGISRSEFIRRAIDHELLLSAG